MNGYKVPISNGELIDKITILRIKNNQIQDENKLVNIRGELASLIEFENEILRMFPILKPLISKLHEINENIWKLEDEIRKLHSKKLYGDDFATVARNIFELNDNRSIVKKEINICTTSDLVEEKSYDYM